MSDDRQFQLIMEKLTAIEKTQARHEMAFENLRIKLNAGLQADEDNRKLITLVENLQKDILSLRDEFKA